MKENPSADSRALVEARFVAELSLDDPMRPRGLRALELADVGELTHGFGHRFVDLHGLFVRGYEHLEESSVALSENEGRHAECPMLFHGDGVGLCDVFQQFWVGRVGEFSPVSR